MLNLSEKSMRYLYDVLSEQCTFMYYVEQSKADEALAVMKEIAGQLNEKPFVVRKDGERLWLVRP